MADLSPRSAMAKDAAGLGRKSPRAREREGLWHRPAVLNLATEVLTLCAALALGYALVVWFLSRPLFPLREVVVMTPPAHVTAAQLEYAARTAVRGNFFSVDLDAVRAKFEKLPWVRRADVRRRWPDALELRLEEHQAMAYWTVSDGGESRLLNRQGEVFVAASDAAMPSFSGPQGSAPFLHARYLEFMQTLAPLGRRIVSLALTAREAWELRLDDGMVIVLGRDQERAPIDRRLEQFVAAWPKTVAAVGVPIAVADLRYTGGFALTPAGDVKVSPKGRK